MKLTDGFSDIFTRNKRYFLLLVSLVPIVVWSQVIYGFRAVRLELTALGVCLGLHLLTFVVAKYLFKRERMLFDLSFAVSGLLLVLSLPWNVRYPVLVAGCAVAMLSRELLGGLGRNPLNPALAGRAFIEIFFGEQTKVIPTFDTDSGESALEAVLQNRIPEADALDLFLGRADGNLGEISALLLLLSLVFLLVNKVIKWQTPVFFLVSAAVVSILIAPDNISYFHYMAGHMLSSGLVFCAVYFCNDPVTTPQTSSGRILFGALCGGLSIASRIYLSYECVYLLILIMGFWSPFIDRMFRPGVFGGLLVRPDKKEGAKGKTGAEVKVPDNPVKKEKVQGDGI